MYSKLGKRVIFICRFGYPFEVNNGGIIGNVCRKYLRQDKNGSLKNLFDASMCALWP